MEIKRYVCIRASTYVEQQAILAKFPQSFFINRGNEVIDFFLPIYEEDIVREFINNWNQKEKKRIEIN